MCGIAGIYLRDPSFEVDMDEITSTLLAEIEERGQHATGVVAIGDEGEIEWQKASCDATTFNRYRRIIPNSARVVLGHTRWATQGLPAFMENNHPIKRGPFYIIHNGHVSNDSELFKKADRSRFGDVDSEAIAAHLSYMGDLSKLAEVMAEIEGDAAVAAVDERDCRRLAIARGRSSPLYIYNGERFVLFASTEKAIVKAHATHIGTLSAKRLMYVKEGFALEWKGDADYEAVEFKVKERKWTYYTSGSTFKSGGWKPKGYSWDYDDDFYKDKPYAWESSLDGQLKSIESKSKDTEQDEIDVEIIYSSEARDDEERNDEDVIICDNCDAPVWWDECETRWVYGENVSFLLCMRCADEFDEQEWLDETTAERLGLWDEEDEEDEDEVDDDGFSFRRVDPEEAGFSHELNDFDPAEIEDSEIVDNYEAANESIVRSLARKLMNGGSNAV